MPLQLPVLDDRRFADLVKEAQSLIPTYAPEWTNHNPTDPGITLVELFAHLAEMLIYRLDRVTTANKVSFLNLLDGKARDVRAFEGKDSELAAETRATILALRERDRAVSCADFEELAVKADPQRIERAWCVPRRNLVKSLDQNEPGHVSVIVLPADGVAAVDVPALLAKVRDYLEPRLLLTTRAHVVAPVYLTVGVKATVVLRPDQEEVTRLRNGTMKDVKKTIADTVAAFLDPHTGGDDGTGWPFGRDVFASEIYALIDRLPEVDYVTNLSLTATPADRVLRTEPGGKLIGVSVKAYELVKAQIAPGDITVNPA